MAELEKTKLVKFKVPFKLNGSEVSELLLDFSDIDGDELGALEDSFKQLYSDYVPSIILDSRYHKLLAARAAKVNPADLGKLWGPDYTSLLLAARNFLLGAG